VRESTRTIGRCKEETHTYKRPHRQENTGRREEKRERKKKGKTKY
jgi:hypothetical protein